LKPGSTSDTFVSQVSLPSSTIVASTALVNAFEVEPIANIVCSSTFAG
jgi:hypothetical protein